MNLLDCEMMSDEQEESLMATSKAANTCTDIREEDPYMALVNVPGINDLEIESLRAIYNKDFGDYQLVAKVGTQSLEQYSQFDIDSGRNEWQMAMVLNDFQADSTVIDVEISNTLLRISLGLLVLSI